MTGRIVITGASRGIGRAIAVKLAAEGSDLILHGRDADALDQTLAQVIKKKASAKTVIADLSSPDEIRTLVSSIGQTPVDCLVNNAAIAVVKPVEELTMDEWRRTLAVNVTAPFLLTQQLLPLMPRGASIVNILSIAARTGYPNWGSYCMSKFALEGFSQSLREELRPKGIRIINIYPAATDTDIWNEIPGQRPREEMMPAGEVAEAVAYALSRPSSVAVDDITLGSSSG